MSRNSNSPVNDLLAVAVFERVWHLPDVLGRSWLVEPGVGISKTQVKKIFDKSRQCGLLKRFSFQVMKFLQERIKSATNQSWFDQCRASVNFDCMPWTVCRHNQFQKTGKKPRELSSQLLVEVAHALKLGKRESVVTFHYWRPFSGLLQRNLV